MQVESDYIKQEAKKPCYWMKDGVFNIVAWTEAMMQLSADRAGSKIRQLESALRLKTEEHDNCAKDLLLWRTSYEHSCTQNVHLCAKIDDCRPFLKEGESPAEGLARFRTKITDIFGRWTLFMDEQKLKDAVCRPYLKEGETVADELIRMQKEITTLRNAAMQLWGDRSACDKEDAARYRWLLEHPKFAIYCFSYLPGQVSAEIDKARAAQEVAG